MTLVAVLGELVDQLVVVAVGEIVQVLHAHDRGDRPRLGDLLRRRVADSQVPDQALLPEFGERLERLGERAGLRSLGVWVTLILAGLGSDGSHQPGTRCAGQPRPMRYSELARLLAGVSQKMLTQTLRSLERDGLITRTAMPTVPVTVTYELTDLGLSLHQMMRGIKTWAETHMDDVLANRGTYDTRSA